MTQLNAKAAAMRSMAYWVRDLCLEHASTHGAHGALRAALFCAFVQADVTCRRAGRHMGDDARAALAESVEQALVAYNGLARNALADGKQLWKVLPKLHALSHLGFDNNGINPRSVSCYQDEDVVGRMKRVYAKCHGLTAPQRALERYVIMAALRFRQHLMILRGVVAGPAAAGPAAGGASSSSSRVATSTGAPRSGGFTGPAEPGAEGAPAAAGAAPEQPTPATAGVGVGVKRKRDRPA